jgi:hypothetical protein
LKIFFHDAPFGKTTEREVAFWVVTGATRYFGPSKYWSLTPTQFGSSGNSYHYMQSTGTITTVSGNGRLVSGNGRLVRN